MVYYIVDFSIIKVIITDEIYLENLVTIKTLLHIVNDFQLQVTLVLQLAVEEMIN